MISKFLINTRIIALGTGILFFSACGLLVTPPDNYPPEDDTTSPATPDTVLVDIGVQVLSTHCKPAIMIQWGPSASSDLLYYKLYREYNNEVKDITATLKTTRYYYDTHLDFPVNSGNNYVYYYHVTAYDSSGNESLPSVIDRISLVAPPILLYPAGTIGAADLVSGHFSWNVLQNVGKSFAVFILTAAGDTVVSARFDPDSYDEVEFRKTYNELKTISDRPGPDMLTPGQYYWWVIITLYESTNTAPKRRSVAIRRFSIQVSK